MNGQPLSELTYCSGHIGTGRMNRIRESILADAFTGKESSHFRMRLSPLASLKS